LQLGDVNFLGRQLAVARQVQRAGGSEVEVRAPKYGSERVVFVADGLVALLSAHVASFPVGSDGWLFTGPTGEPPHQNTVGYWWRKTLRNAGLSGIKLHDYADLRVMPTSAPICCSAWRSDCYGSA
jgi:integrase